MDNQKGAIYINNTLHSRSNERVEGDYIQLMGEDYYKITNYDQMPPFFMSIVSDSDHWLFISSTGGLSAGRQNAESALFPYYTEDKITENSENTGSKTLLLVKKETNMFLWEPLSSRYAGMYQIQRNLYKNVYGNKLIFEEINDDLQLTFRYAWCTSDRYGFVKSCWLNNEDTVSCQIEILDGLQNLLPYGVTSLTQNTFSVLLDAYKRNELDKTSGLGIFTLSSTLTDLAEPSESLKATTVWQAGLDPAKYLLSSRQIEHFRHGHDMKEETDLRGVRGAFWVNAQVTLAPSKEKSWYIVAEVNQDNSSVVALRNTLKRDRMELCSQLSADIEKGSENLVAIVASADGLQTSEDHLSSAHHFSNVLFNTMRGGVFADNYNIPKVDLLDFLKTRNSTVFQSHTKFYTQLPDTICLNDLLQRAARSNSADLERLCYEYLPLIFSRRHGDPSRPWNTFSINLKNEDGSQKLDYQGNWRDIFQNWEPLAYSYPEFVESMLCKFLNATTADGYNPYRVTRDGIEWEVPEPENPWANIGYWSDHQIIYLQKLLEISEKFHPSVLQQKLGQKVFSHTNVPYKIKAYESILEDWYATIEFDADQHQRIEDLVITMGTDGKLVLDAEGKVFHVNLAEKLLILLLAKLSNFVPEGGIWMNTQRPEWNDANNALVGKGLSVVTTCYLRRFVTFCITLFQTYEQTDLSLTQEVNTWFKSVNATLEKYQHILHASFSHAERRTVMDELGRAGSFYRLHYYKHGLSGECVTVSRDTLVVFLELVLKYLEQTIRANRREDGLYHAYNVLQLREREASVRYLYQMLEGQVAVLSSGMLSAEESLEVLKALRTSKMYRADQHSYMLYPDRDLPGFLAKNCLTADQVRDSQLIAKLVADSNNTLICKDENGIYHFYGAFRNAKDVQTALDELKSQRGYADLVEKESEMILSLFEEVFDHDSFTGRSGTFFAYEGLGSIYWHMVSKLLLVTQERFLWAVEQNESANVIKELADAYYDTRSGFGFNKSPEVYGAFPTDPYSHTPSGKGAKQPGMTGQVKEEILTRLVELGLFVSEGRITFNPVLLRKQEFTTQNQVFQYVDVSRQKGELDLQAGSLAYTFCQVPIVYISSPLRKVEIVCSDGTCLEVEGNSLDTEVSRHIFQRNGHIERIIVYTEAGL